MKRRRAYRKQGEGSDCGPYALYNLMIWAGKKKSIRKLRKLVKYDKVQGTFPPFITQAIEHLGGVKIEAKISYPKLEDIDNALDNGFAVILMYFCPSAEDGHYNLCIDRDAKTYTLVNDGEDRATVTTRNRKELKKMLRYSCDDDFGLIWYPCAWVVGKS